jgi:hypothetical protein
MSIPRDMRQTGFHMFFRRPLPLLEFGREQEEVDLSKVTLTHHALKNQGKTPMVLDAGEVRESHRIQALIAEIGHKMGFKIWIPRSDRERVRAAAKTDLTQAMVEQLPMNYNDATIRTIEQIDVLWLRGRSIARAFEVEHTTAIYSGLLRMADLVALQPDINIPLHIVAPEERQQAVLDQIQRPVFSLLETGPLANRCSLIVYDDIRDLAGQTNLSHMRDTIVDEHTIFAQAT